MSDEQRRELERRVAANPGDFVAGHALVRALERAGETARARSELARMARRGDRDAWRRVARLSAPKPSGRRIGERDGVADPRTCRTAVSEPFEGLAVLAASDAELLVMASSEAVTALDTTTLQPSFRDEHGSFSGAALPSAFAWMSQEGLRVRGRDFGVTCREGECVQALTGGSERIAFAVRSRRGLSLVGVLDVQGETLWEQSVPSQDPDLVIAGDRLVCAGARDGTLAVDVFSLDTAERVFERHFAASHVAAADPGAVVVRGGDNVFELDLETGTERPLGALGAPRYSREHVVVFDNVVLLGFARGEARARWHADLRGHGTTSFVIAGDHVWWATASASTLLVVVLDARDGGEIRRQEFDLRDASNLLWVPHDGAMLLVVKWRAAMRIIRFEPA